MNLRTITAGGAALLALTFAPAAQATPPALPDGSAVCNTASQNWQGGTLDVASPPDPQGALRYADELRPKKNNGVGLFNAAMHSRALAVCADAATLAGDGSGGSIYIGT